MAAALAFDKPVHDKIYDNKEGIVDGTQEDVDLLVAFEDSGLTHVIMLEAKGVGAYDNSQFKHKMDRLRSIFGETGSTFAKVKPHFGLISPHEPKHLDPDGDVCLSWLKVNGKVPWLRMQIPERLALYGCDYQGKSDNERRFWTTRPQLREKVSR
jgi:hypothetical protein